MMLHVKDEATDPQTIDEMVEPLIRLTPARKRRRFQFSLRALLIASVALNILLAVSMTAWTAREATDGLGDLRDFSRRLASANRIVVHDGFSSPGRDGKILFEIADRSELVEFHSHLQLQPDDAYSHDHICYGGLGIQWYRDGARIARAELRDGVLTGCEGYTGQGEPHLSRKSASWLRTWLRHRGLKSRELELIIPSR